MEPAFWLKRWSEHRTGFHRDAPMPYMVQHWPTLALAQSSRVLVPLAGKSLDMPWLAAQGHQVLGVELSPLAVKEFLAEHSLEAESQETTEGVHHTAGSIEIIQGDIFGLSAATLERCTGVYDRAALIALPPLMQERYVREVYGRLPTGCRGLLITLEYPPEQMAGPPFSIDASRVNALFGNQWLVEPLERIDVLASNPGFGEKGVTALHTTVYELERTGADG